MNWLKNKKWRFLLLFNRPCLVFLFFIDRYSSVYHLPMINLTKVTATRRHVYPKMTTFQKRSELFHGRQPEHCVCSTAPTSKADVSVGTQMDLKARIQSLYSDESRFIVEHHYVRKKVYRKQIERFHTQCISDVRASDYRCVMVRGAKSTTSCSQLVMIRGNVTAQ